MAITRIRGGQIQDRTIEGIKIMQNTLLNEHVANNAAISESKLDIDWGSHYQSALESKKIIDFVQVNDIVVDGAAELDLTGGTDVIIPGTAAQATSDGMEEGILVDGEKNKAIIRDAVTGDPILDDKGQEVYGRVTFDSASNGYKMSFFSYDKDAGAEVAFTMPAAQKIDFQYAERFNLQTVSELFAANERFVDGVADATSYLNIEQLAKDLYGSTYTLDRDGNANLAKSLAQQISEEVTRAQTAESGLQSNIDAEATARQTADAQIISDLASNGTGKGAATVGIEDADGLITATTVEAALKEIVTNLNAEVSARTAAGSASGTALTQEISDRQAADSALDSKITAEVTRATGEEARIEGKVDAEVTRATAAEAQLTSDLAAEVTRATGVEAGLQTALTQEISDRQAADQATKDDLASTNAGKGASLVGVDSTKGFTGSTVEAVLENLQSRLVTQESGGGAEVSATHTRDADSANGYFKINLVPFVDLEARLVDIETISDVQFKAAADTTAEVVAARGTEADLKTRLDKALNSDGTLKIGTQVHTHKKYITTIASNTNVINMPVGENFVTDGSLDVYVNGILQANGTNFTEVVDGSGNGTGINFGSDNLLVGDVIVIKYIKYNAE